MNYLIIGGAGFIGSYLVEEFLNDSITTKVTVYDNFSSGKKWHLENYSHDKRLNVIEADIYSKEIYKAAKDISVAIILAANPDIAKAVTEPDIDFKQGTALTQISLEALRLGGCKRILYSSGSGVYGDVGHEFVAESHSNMMPISTYGASKLGCEALISSYCHMFGMKASIFRFGNVVGGRQTHGVGFDFIKYLLANSRELQILGDGGQSKPYVHVSDVVRAMLMVLKLQTSIFEVFNVAPEDFVSVKEIASIVLNEMHIQDAACKLHFTGGDRGWKGDVPIIRLDTSKIRKWGWSNLHSSAEAVRLAVREMLGNAKRLYE